MELKRGVAMTAATGNDIHGLSKNEKKDPYIESIYEPMHLNPYY